MDEYAGVVRWTSSSCPQQGLRHALDRIRDFSQDAYLPCAKADCVTSGKFRHLISLCVCTQNRRNNSQSKAGGLLNVLQTAGRYCLFVAAKNAVKVHVSVLRRLIMLRVCTGKRRNNSQRIARGLRSVLQTAGRYCSFVAAKNTVKVHASVFDAYMRHRHLPTCIIGRIYASLVIKGLNCNCNCKPTQQMGEAPLHF